MVKYNCLICGTTPDKKSHHANHKRTKKHKLKKENLTLKLQQKSEEELLSEYQETDVELIISKLENNIVETDESDQINEIDESSGLDLNDLIEQDFESIHKTSNKDALKDKIHEIHNFLRNNGAGYGMSALKVFNVLYGLKRIEQYGINEKIGYGKEHLFSHLLDDIKKNKNKLNFSELLRDRVKKNVLDKIWQSKDPVNNPNNPVNNQNNPNLFKLLFYEIPENIKGEAYIKLIECIEKLTKIEDQTNTNLSGKVYEYFIGRDDSAISELGAYFTNRLITKYIYNELCPPELNDDGSVPTMIDMFGGSGGFTLGYINYLNDNYNIDWKNNFNSIYHFDANEDVIKSAGLEIFCATQQLPDLTHNVCYKNSFTADFTGKDKLEQKYHYIYTNPPYGGDKISKTDTQLKNERILKHIKEKLNIKSKRDIDILRCNSDPYYKSMVQQYLNLEKFEKDFKQNVKNNNVNWDTAGGRAKKYCNQYSLSEKCKDKESMSLIIMMMLLEENGTAVGVLKEGVFFDSKYKILRKHLIQNFNVTHVVSVPQDQFENTSTKTSIIVFKNTEQKTTNIKFSELEVETFTEDIFEISDGIVTLKEAKDEVKGVNDNFIVNASIDEIEQQDFNLNSKNYNKKLIIPGDGFEIVKLGDICDIKRGTRLEKSKIIVENGIYPVFGAGKLIGYSNIKNRNNNLNCIICRVGSLKSSDCCKLINSELYLTDAAFSIESLDSKIHYYLSYYLNFNYDKIFISLSGGSVQMTISQSVLKEIQIPIPTNPEQIQYWVDTISEPYDLKIENLNRVETLEQEVQDRIQHIIEHEDCEEIELGELCEYIKSGNPIKKSDRIGTKYPYYAANGVSGYVDEYIFNGKHILCAQDGSIGSTYLVNRKFYASNHVWILKVKNYINYIYRFLKYILNYNELAITGSIIKKLSLSILKKIKIPIPKNKQLITDLESKFQEIEQCQENVKTFEQQYEQKLKDLYQAAVKEIK